MAGITVFGSVVLDMVTRVANLPGPGETVLTDVYQFEPGGKGANQALAAARAGASVRLLGAVGDDPFAEIALRNLRHDGVNLDGLETTTAAPTGCATVAVDERGENQIIVAAGANFHARAAQLTDEVMASSTILLLQLELPLLETWKAVEQAKAAELTVILNAAPFAALPSHVLKAIDVLIVNQVEAQQLARQQELSAPTVDALAEMLADKFASTIVVTLGRDGAVCASASRYYRIPAMTIAVVDTVGAGDAFVGAFSAAMAAAADMETCLKWGSVAGALACTALGAQTAAPPAADIEAHLDQLVVTRSA